MFVPASWTHQGVMAEYPPLERFLGRLGDLGRLVLFDKRGTGMSDPVPSRSIPALEEWMDDVTTVLDHVGAAKAHLIGMEAGGPMALLYAATHPERIDGLVLLNTFARLSQAADHPIGVPSHVQDRIVGRLLDTEEAPHWWDAFGEGGTSHPGAEWSAKFARYAVGPGAAAANLRATFDIDVRHVLPSVQAPALVIHRTGNRYVRLEHGRHLAANLDGAQLVEVPGPHFPWEGDPEPVLAPIEEFVGGSIGSARLDRVLATVLFTDIIASTERAATVGDAAWTRLLEAHDGIARHEVVRARGQIVKHTGDGVLATFDGPARAVRCAHSLVDRLAELGLEIRAGIHTGEIELRPGGDIGGIAVHIGARVASTASASEVLVSGVVPALVAGSGLRFADHGTHQLKGVPEPWQLFVALRDRTY